MKTEENVNVDPDLIFEAFKKNPSLELLKKTLAALAVASNVTNKIFYCSSITSPETEEFFKSNQGAFVALVNAAIGFAKNDQDLDKVDNIFGWRIIQFLDEEHRKQINKRYGDYLKTREDKEEKGGE